MHIGIYKTARQHSLNRVSLQYLCKNVMQGKLIAFAYTLRVYIETSSVWAEFVYKKCLIVRLVSEEVKSIEILIILIIHIIVSYEQNISLIFLCERWNPCQAVTSVLCLHYRPETVHCSTKDAYTSEITFLALHPCTS